jgi:hypothetical protein
MKQNLHCSNIKPLIKLIIISSIFYLALFWYFDLWDIKNQCPDASSYQEATRYLYLENFKPHIVRPIGYPLVLGYPLLFTTNSSILSLYFSIIHFFFWLSTVVLLYVFLLKITSKYAFGLSILFSLNIGSIVLASHTIAETFFTFILLASFYFWYAYWTSKNTKSLLFSFLLFCFSVIVKPIGLYFCFIFLCVLVYQFIRRSYVRFIFIGVLFFLLTVGQRMYQMNKYYKIQNLSTVQDIDLYLYLSAYSEGIHLSDKNERTQLWQDTFKQRAIVLDGIIKKEGWSKSCSFARQQFFNRLKDNPLAILKTYIRDVFSNSIGYSGFFERKDEQIKRPLFYYSIILTKIITSIQNSFYSFGMLLLIPILCLIQYKKKGTLKIPWHWLGGWFFCMYIIFSSGIAFASGDRLHIVIVPIALTCLAAVFSEFSVLSPFSIYKPQRQSEKILPPTEPLIF